MILSDFLKKNIIIIYSFYNIISANPFVAAVRGINNLRILIGKIYIHRLILYSSKDLNYQVHIPVIIFDDTDKMIMKSFWKSKHKNHANLCLNGWQQRYEKKNYVEQEKRNS